MLENIGKHKLGAEKLGKTWKIDNLKNSENIGNIWRNQR